MLYKERNCCGNFKRLREEMASLDRQGKVAEGPYQQRHDLRVRHVGTVQDSANTNKPQFWS